MKISNILLLLTTFVLVSQATDNMTANMGDKNEVKPHQVQPAKDDLKFW